MEGIARDAVTASIVVDAAAAGDAIAFARLVAAYHADMIRVAFVVSGGDQDAADTGVAVSRKRTGPAVRAHPPPARR